MLALGTVSEASFCRLPRRLALLEPWCGGGAEEEDGEGAGVD